MVLSNTSPKLLNLNQDHPLKNLFFCLNPYKIEVVITFAIEMLEQTKLWSLDHIYNIS